MIRSRGIWWCAVVILWAAWAYCLYVVAAHPGNRVAVGFLAGLGVALVAQALAQVGGERTTGYREDPPQ